MSQGCEAFILTLTIIYKINTIKKQKKIFITTNYHNNKNFNVDVVHLVLKKYQLLHFLSWNESSLTSNNISHYFYFLYFFFFKTAKNVHFLMKTHILCPIALICAL